MAKPLSVYDNLETAQDLVEKLIEIPGLPSLDPVSTTTRPGLGLEHRHLEQLYTQKFLARSSSIVTC